MVESKNFLFDRLSYYASSFSGRVGSTFSSVDKGDSDEKEISSAAVAKVIAKCNKRAGWYRFTFIVFVILASLADPICTMLTNYRDRLIIAIVSSIAIFIANFLAWPQYAEKLYSIVDCLEDMKDNIDMGEELSEREKRRLKRIMEMVNMPYLFSDKVRPLSMINIPTSP